MNKLEKLIAQQCPNGVEYKELVEVCSDFIVPMRDSPQVFDGEIPWCRIEDIQGDSIHGSLSGLKVSMKVISDMNLKVMPTGTVIASCSASLGRYAITTTPLITNQTFIGLVCGERLLNRYLLHLLPLKTQELVALSNSGTIPYISRAKFEKLRIPVPPIEVQQEIVNILDFFSELVGELEAELEARKNQFEHYRKQHLSLRDVPLIPMGQLLKLQAGKFLNATAISQTAEMQSLYPCFGGNGLRGYVSQFSHDGEFILIGRQGALSGNVKRTVGKFYATEHAIVVTPNEECDISWLYHVLTEMNLNQYVSKGAQPGLSVGNLEKVEIGVPPLAIQQKLGSILDGFNTLVHDDSEGLPAEIIARRQQYEFYRNKLLNFKTLEVA